MSSRKRAEKRESTREIDEDSRDLEMCCEKIEVTKTSNFAVSGRTECSYSRNMYELLIICSA